MPSHFLSPLMLLFVCYVYVYVACLCVHVCEGVFACAYVITAVFLYHTPPCFLFLCFYSVLGEEVASHSVCVEVGGHACELVLSFNHMDPRDRAQVIRLGDVYLISPLPYLWRQYLSLNPELTN